VNSRACSESVRVLELSKVCKQYGTDPAVNALVEVDLSLNRGEWLAITGPSGAGKSTLLNIIGCLDRSTSGSYRFDGVETTTLSDRQRAGLRSQRIGFVFPELVVGDECKKLFWVIGFPGQRMRSRK
jgi:macrolide transport system ATP-binding/permease protein